MTVRSVFNSALSLIARKPNRLVVLDDNGQECPLLINRVLLSFRGVAESTRKLNNAEFILIDENVYVVKWLRADPH